MRKPIAWLTVPFLVLSLPGCRDHDDGESLSRLHDTMAAVKHSAEAVLVGKPPADRQGLATLSRQIAAADRDVDAAQQLANSLTESPTLQAAALDYLKAVRATVDQTRERCATAIALREAMVQDRGVSASIDQAQDEAALERARVDADAKAGAVAASVNHAGNAVVEQERRLESLVTALQRDAQPLAGYALVSHDALDAAMASNASPDRSLPVRISIDGDGSAGH
jgi:hypothetical protein